MKNLQRPPQLGMDELWMTHLEDAAELEIGMDATWASKARSLGSSGASVLLGFLTEVNCCARFLPAGR